MPSPASAYEAQAIQNGRYTFEENSGFEVRYKIYTVTRGQWAGKRVIKAHTGTDRFSDGYEAFAFLNQDYSYTIWSRFAGDVRPFVGLVGEFLIRLRHQRFGEFNDAWLYRDDTNCNVCNEAGGQCCPLPDEGMSGNDSSLSDEEVERWLTRCEVTGSEIQ
jgi:hypothetical protein